MLQRSPHDVLLATEVFGRQETRAAVPLSCCAGIYEMSCILCGRETTMTGSSASLTRRPEWATLQEHYQKIKEVHLRQLFADDPTRGERLTAEAVGLYFDYSKHRLTDETIHLLVQLAEACGLRERIDAMFRGDKINRTEDRAVLHVALRAPKGQSIVVDGQDAVPQVHEILERMADFADQVRSGAWKGYTGKRIR